MQGTATLSASRSMSPFSTDMSVPLRSDWMLRLIWSNNVCKYGIFTWCFKGSAAAILMMYA